MKNEQDRREISGTQIGQPQGRYAGAERRAGIERRTRTLARRSESGRSESGQGQSGVQNEGEGSRTAARHYAEGVRRFVDSGQVDAKAHEAAAALDGKESAELERAEQEGKSRREISRRNSDSSSR